MEGQMKQVIKQHYEAGDDRRRQIASAARKLIAEKGFEGLRTREIADAVGINVATMHYHVPNKEALIVLIAESLGEELEADRAAMRRDGPPLELFEAELENYGQRLQKRPETMKVFSELMQRAGRDETIRRIMTPFADQWHNRFTEIFEQGIKTGDFRPGLNPVAAASITMGAAIHHRHKLKQEFAALKSELVNAFRKH